MDPHSEGSYTASIHALRQGACYLSLPCLWASSIRRLAASLAVALHDFLSAVDCAVLAPMSFRPVFDGTRPFSPEPADFLLVLIGAVHSTISFSEQGSPFVALCSICVKVDVVQSDSVR